MRLPPSAIIAITGWLFNNRAPWPIWIVRNVDDAIANALKLRASRHGISTEAEHRRILNRRRCAAQEILPRSVAPDAPMWARRGLRQQGERPAADVFD